MRVLVSGLNGKGRKVVLIYGAGFAGRQLAMALRNSESYKVAGFIDNDKTLENTVIMGMQVHDVSRAAYLVEKYDVTQILLAVPSASRARRRKILESLINLSAEVLTVPDMKDIVEGKASIDQLKDVAIGRLTGARSGDTSAMFNGIEYLR